MESESLRPSATDVVGGMLEQDSNRTISSQDSPISSQKSKSSRISLSLPKIGPFAGVHPPSSAGRRVRVRGGRMALGVSWSLKNISLLIGSLIFVLIYWTSRHTIPDIPLDSSSSSSDSSIPDYTPDAPMHHKLDWDFPANYKPPPPPLKAPKPPPIPWAEAKFKADAEEAAKRRKEEHERKLAESPENKKKTEELFKKIAEQQQRALAEQAALEAAYGNSGQLPHQTDLSLPLPTLNTHDLRRHNPHNWRGPGNPTIATYLSSPGSSLQDPYFLATLQQTYRLLWNPRTKSKHTFTVFVAPHISDEQRDLLSAAGALVKELDPIYHTSTEQFPRWKHQFAKLHLWAQFDFSRILYIDADAFPMGSIDDVLDLPQLGCKRELLGEDQGLADIICQYSFNVAPRVYGEVGGEGKTRELNTGVMLLQPNDSMHKRLLRGLGDGKIKWEGRWGDQGFLSEMFKGQGAFPWEGLERRWNGFFAQGDGEFFFFFFEILF